MTTVGVVTALREEADCLRGLKGAMVDHSGVGGEKAAALARRFLDEGCEALASAGYCGGLAPGIDVGSLILADTVEAPDGARFETHAPWRAHLAMTMGAVTPIAVGPMVCSDTALRTPEAKADARRRTGALAVDMESHAVAAVAAEAGAPFVVIRVVSDDAGSTLPAIVGKGLTPTGERRVGPILAGLARQPWMLGSLMRLAVTSGRARVTLRLFAEAAGE